MQPYYQKFGYKVGDFPNAENYYASAMSLPLYTQLEHQQQDQVVEALIKSLS
jgi:dTDP-4-amino-4,6-dideoxygalactose transaminase